MAPNPIINIIRGERTVLPEPLAGNRLITVFGSRLIRPGDLRYDEGILMGTLIAQKGYIAATGGYDGIMEAVSKGAAEAGGQVIGVTCESIEKAHKKTHNQWVGTEVRALELRDRIHALIDFAHALVVLPGGVGTLGEVGIAWAGMQAREYPNKPFIFVGEGWKETIAHFLQGMKGLIEPEDEAMALFAPDARAAAAMIPER